MKVHLIDGTFELFRCFHGAPRATAPDGSEVGATRALVATFASLLRRPDVTHVAVAFDAMAPPRGAVGGAAGQIRSQGLLAWEVVRALGMQMWPMTRYQADDALASGAAQLHGRVEQVVICTSDRDLLQCVRGDEVILWNRIRDERTNEAALRARYGVGPEQIPDLFALVGDPSDGLPGIEGWGWKSAAAVLQAYPGVDEIPTDPDSWEVSVRGKARLSANLEARRIEAELGRDLSILRADLPVKTGLGLLQWRGPDDAALADLLRRLGDPGLADWVPDRLRKALNSGAQ